MRSFLIKHASRFWAAAALPLAITLAYLLAVVFQEKIAVAGGLGWDGKDYGAWANNLKSVLRDRLDDYYAQRVLPSALVYVALKTLRLARSTENIIRAFEIANVLLVSASAFSYQAAARQLRVSRTSQWWGAIAMFASFGILKYSAFYPVLTDVWGFAFGMLQLQFFLSGRVYALAALTLVGAFAWPTLLLFGVVLLFFPRPAHDELRPRPAPWHLHDLCAALLTGAWLWVSTPKALAGYGFSSSTGTIDVTVVRLSLVLSAAYLFWGARQLLDRASLFDPRAYWRALSLRGALLALLVAAVALRLRARLSNGPGRYDLQSNLDQAIFSALKEPGIFALSHVVYWGPFVLFLFFRWRSCVAALHRAGVGLTLLALGGVVLGLNSESRKLVNLVPIFILFALPELDRLAPKKRDLIGFAAVALLFSRVWLTLDPKVGKPLSEFPAQMLFMVIGPWMTPATYALQLAIVATFALAAVPWLRERLQDAAARSASAASSRREFELEQEGLTASPLPAPPPNTDPPQAH